mmetsp:Transcript_14404/g.43553  ORF Transcript_14404/g.43553 Transcript_14404/m.43553 type:complete len:374 (+) Transcript_14404:85-1206(+)
MIQGRPARVGVSTAASHGCHTQDLSAAQGVKGLVGRSARAGERCASGQESGWKHQLQHVKRQPRTAVRSHIGGAGALGPPLNGQLLRVVAAAGVGGQGREEVGPTGSASLSDGAGRGPVYMDFPSRSGQPESLEEEQPKLIRVRLSVHYRVHSRQMLCIGGNQIPFGWSFMSIAKVPMQWSEGDIWSAEFDLPVNSKMEYKYVIMEEQDWTTQVSEDAEGIVSFRYRTQPDEPPDVQTIQKQMAIVAWQPGPNRLVHLPSEEEVETLEEGEVRPREAARPASQQRTSPQYTPGRQYGQQALGGQGTRGQAAQGAPGSRQQQPAGEADDDPLAGTWETLNLAGGVAMLERRDVWGLPDPAPRLSPMEGLRFDSQ